MKSSKTMMTTAMMVMGGDPAVYAPCRHRSSIFFCSTAAPSSSPKIICHLPVFHWSSKASPIFSANNNVDPSSFSKLRRSFSSSFDSSTSPSPPFAASARLNCVPAARAYSTDSVQNSAKVNMADDPVVSPQWLHSRLNDPNIKVLDASWYMPADKRNPFQEYKESRIPGALFFDVDGVVDPTSNLPHMLPSESAFAAAVSSLGISNSDTVVVYDGKGIFSAARVWWMFRTFSHKNVVVLDGGLPKWRAFGFNLEEAIPDDLVEQIKKASEAVKNVYKGQKVDAGSFNASLQSELVWSADQVRRNIEDKRRVLIDARSKARFDGAVPEPRQGIRGGHIPDSICVPFTEVLKDGTTLLETSELRQKFEAAGVPLSTPIVASCGTGVTACVLALALHRLGKEDVSVYDGSWTEWGGLPDTPVVTAAGK